MKGVASFANYLRFAAVVVLDHIQKTIADLLRSWTFVCEGTPGSDRQSIRFGKI